MIGQDELYLNCQVWILTLTLFDGLTELLSSYTSSLPMWVDFLVPTTPLNLCDHVVVHIFRILIFIIAGRSSRVSGRLSYVPF
jgi:hypothetical protein